MTGIAIASNALGAVAFAILVLLLLRGANRSPVAVLLLGAASTSCLWFLGAAWHSVQGSAESLRGLYAHVEVLRSVLWVTVLLTVVGRRLPAARRGAMVAGTLVSTVLCGVYALYAPADAPGWTTPYLGSLLIGLVGLVLVEQLFRSTRPEHRWHIKFLCLGVGGLFAYDFFMYSHAVLFQDVERHLWVARGATNAFCAPFIAVAVARNRDWKVDLFVSRQVVFHTSVVMAAGVYLLCMALAGFYLRQIGGSWGGVVQAVFLFGALVLLLAGLSSGQVRSRLRVFLTKHFYRNKYDYREEWLAFTQTLAQASGDTRAVLDNVLAAIARIIEARGGMLWLQDDSGENFLPRAALNMTLPLGEKEPRGAPLARFLATTGWVINLTELERDPEKYGGLEPPSWLAQSGEAWLVVPLLVKDDLMGFVVLGRSLGHVRFDWEDSDLLKTVGRQTASYLGLLLATDALAQARQFEAFNRLSAFLVHDLKNVVAQLSLVGANARRFRANPQFVTDAFETVENATAKMSRMLASLQKGQLPGYVLRPVELRSVAEQVVKAHAGARPAPVLKAPPGPLEIFADPERIAAVLSHLIQNAQEATPSEGEVKISLSTADNAVVVEVSDTGCGMDAAFVNERLFKPFDTTKGNAGMGIGAFESREIVTRLGGALEVRSAPGVGTTFTLRLPLAKAGPEAESREPQRASA